MRNVSSIPLLILAILIFSISTTNSTAGESSLKFLQKPGPYAVGFKSVNQYDYSRTFHHGFNSVGQPIEEPARPIQTSIWYPADKEKNKNAARMLYKDYVSLTLLETKFPETVTKEMKEKNLNDFCFGWLVSNNKLGEMELPTNAISNAVAADGLFPLVVYGPSINSMSFENSVLCEYLASHGYIVVSSPSFGRYTRAMTTDPIGTEVQARDMEFLIGYMQNFPHFDRDKIAVMGFSRGVMGAVLTAMRDERVDAVICMDGSIQYAYDVFKKSIFHDPKKLKMPFLFMTSKPKPEEIRKKYNMPPWGEGFLLYEEMIYSDAHWMQFFKLTHQNFSSMMIQLYDRKPEMNECLQPDVNESYNLMSRYVLSFLDAYIKSDAAALKYITNTPKANGTPDGLVRLMSKKGKPAPPTTGEFFFKIRKSGIDQLQKVYEDVKKEFSEFVLDKDAILEFALNMVKEQRFEDAETVCKFMVQIHPDYIYSHYGLAEIFKMRGNKKDAIKEYQKVLEMEQGMDFLEVKKKIEELQKD